MPIYQQPPPDETLYEAEDIVYKDGIARMFGIDGPGYTDRVNYLIKKGAVPPCRGYIGRRGFWLRMDIRAARDAAVAGASPTPLKEGKQFGSDPEAGVPALAAGEGGAP